MGLEVTYDDFKDARKRANRAKKLFDKEVMGKIIEGCKIADAGNEASGFEKFDAAVREATNAAEEGLSEAEFTAFITEMWLAAKAARAFQENKPCW